MALRTKVLLLFLLVGLTPLGILGGFSLLRVDDAVRSSTQMQLVSLATEVGREIHRAVNDAGNAIYLLAENPVLVSERATMNELAAELGKTDRFYPMILDLTLLDLDGEVRTSVHHSYRGAWASTSWFQGARDGDRLVSNVHAQLHPYQVVMTVAVPVRELKDGPVRGVLVGQIAMERIWEIVSQVSFGPEGRTRLVDHRGLVVASSFSDEEVLRPLPLTDLVESVGERESWVGHINTDMEKVAVVAPVDGVSQELIQTGWSLVLTQPTARAYPALARLRMGLGMSALLSLVMVVMLAALLSGHVKRRISTLVQATRRLGQGVFDVPLPDLGRDEIGELGRALNRTADALAASDQEIKHYQAHLQELVDSRTADLQAANEYLRREVEERRRVEEERERLGEQLRQSQKMEAVGTLAGGIAHDFNNMLQAISSHVQLLRMSCGDVCPTNCRESVRTGLNRIAQTVNRATELVQRLLTFSRRGESRRIRHNLNDDIRDVVALLGRILPHTIRIEIDADPNLADVSADPVQMEQVLVNLANNARDAMPEGGDLRLETRNVELSPEQAAAYLGLSPGPHVRLAVSDTGAGMDATTLRHIFEPFFTTKEVGKGTGLGLSMVYGIVRDHEGMIACASQTGKGTTFTMLLPALEPVRDAAPDSPEESLGGAEADPRAGSEAFRTSSAGVKILMVDDEEMIREVTAELLTAHGYEVFQAADGLEALEVHARERIDLVITDVGMPGMGGEALLLALRERDPKAKVIISSGYVGVRDNGELRKASGMLTKPYKLEELLGMVRGLLEEKHEEAARQSDKTASPDTSR
ncbi:response regulator [Desulfonatronum lacustre]|uniref:response regulator n=1 Tax=Desulfonatronum lacustre TaxID=66849 RepID=UPI0004B3571B|nr:response regulator [Desulfonatronum lacustre]